MYSLFCVNANLFCKLLPVFMRVLHKILSEKLISCSVGENSVERVVQKSTPEQTSTRASFV